jgi:uncharacterized protein (TIGR02246 family)
MKQLQLFLSIPFMALLFTFAQAQTPPRVSHAVTYEAGVAKHKEIDSIYHRFNEAYEKLDAEIVAGLYTDDAMYLVPDNEVIRGRENIRKNFANFFEYNKQKGTNLSINFKILRRSVRGDLGYDVGIYTLQSTKDGKILGEDKGKFVVITRKMKDNSWKFELDSYSALKPPEKK